MASFARVEGDSVVEVFDALPLNWRHISNFYLLCSNGPALSALGWYAIVPQPYDRNQHAPIGTRYEFADGQVHERLDLVDRACLATPVDVEMQRIRGERDRLLAASDWTQAMDLHHRFGRWAASWADYRQLLRDYPFHFEQSARTLELPGSPSPTPQPESRHAG